MLGVLTAIQHHKISPQDGEQQVFSHMSIDRLKHSPFHPSFSDLVWKGSEIEDFDNDERTERKEWMATMQNTILNNYRGHHFTMAVKLQSKWMQKPSRSNDLFESCHVYAFQDKYQPHVVPYLPSKQKPNEAFQQTRQSLRQRNSLNTQLSIINTKSGL